ncbi:TVP38/TMEM64 family protein [Aneurinibacillus sp. Ricciae_BoGa-3]|uniref:TVP38/TMEM64 family protein n=1 Tax=Aneurinibacillus sp. Ricciae_BoGa-3 TaxID=3022697 RepID=UPI00234228D1|nr:TVP38/TMEM64 family protein [Aneurinibacillus sp. Ricciae_BoGa-3]WCK52977.1 TVP38/TMEM64 family protein [Aneurinibacillus sp. Ricciae_BoGa-3]
MKSNHFRLIITGIVVVLISMSLLITSLRHFIVQLFTNHGSESFKEYIRSFGFWGPVMSIFFMVLHSILFIPSEIIFFANIYLYGLILGFIYTWIGSILGAYFSFYLAKFYGRSFVKRFVSIEKIKRFDQWFQKNGVLGIFILRFIPLFSFNLLNYGAGLTQLTFWQFTWTTGIGIVPPMIVMAWLYQNTMKENWYLVGLAIVVILLVFMIRIIKLKMKNK